MKTTKGMRVATVWKLCLEMWDARMKCIGKTAWCDENGYELEQACFFCDYALRQQVKANEDNEFFEYKYTCKYCPARAVEPDFSCEDARWTWYRTTIKFHAKLHKMNKKRLAMRRRRTK